MFSINLTLFDIPDIISELLPKTDKNFNFIALGVFPMKFFILLEFSFPPPFMIFFVFFWIFLYFSNFSLFFILLTSNNNNNDTNNDYFFAEKVMEK